MKVSAEAFWDEALAYISKVRETQMDRIKQGGRMIVKCILADGVVHTFGTGHSKAFSMEMSNRAGGLVPVHGIYLDELLRKRREEVNDETKDSNIERDPGVVADILGMINFQPNDLLVMVSNSGRNGSVVEMALQVKRMGLPIIAITSMDHTTRVTSRHPSGKKLYEVADLVIDNCGPFGDAILEIPALPYQVCSISSITGAFIAQALTAEAIKGILEAGQKPPVLISANVDGGDEHNAELRRKYEGRI